MRHLQLRAAACSAALVLSVIAPRAAAAQSASTCTEFIGFSETEQYYATGFIHSVPNPGGYQLRWYSGGSVDLWADRGYAGWGGSALVTRCAQNSGSPDRVVMNVSGDYQSDPNWWAQTTSRVIANIRAKYPSARLIALQPVVGGPGGQRCPISSPDAKLPFVRATYNYPYIKQGLATLVGGDVVLGASPEVRSCGDYRAGDWAGHLTDAGAQAVGANVAGFWANGPSGAAAPPAPAPAPAPPAPAPGPASVAPPDIAPPPEAPPAPDAGAPDAGLAPDADLGAAPDMAPPPDVAPAPEEGVPPLGDTVPTTAALNFDGLSGPGRPLTGQYPNGVIDWGSGAWWLSGPYAQFSSNSVSFNGAGPTSASLTFVSPRTLAAIDADNGGKASSSIALSCDGASTTVATLAPGQTMTISTGWSQPCSKVTIESSNGWDTNFDNLVIQ